MMLTATVEAIPVLTLCMCDLPAGKPKFAVIVVKQSNMQVTMELYERMNGGY